MLEADEQMLVEALIAQAAVEALDEAVRTAWTRKTCATSFGRISSLQNRLLDEPIRQRMGQYGDGELLLVARGGAHSSQNLSNWGEAKADVFGDICRRQNWACKRSP
jgi:hypothetical protein